MEPPTPIIISKTEFNKIILYNSQQYISINIMTNATHKLIIIILNFRVII